MLARCMFVSLLAQLVPLLHTRMLHSNALYACARQTERMSIRMYAHIVTRKGHEPQVTQSSVTTLPNKAYGRTYTCHTARAVTRERMKEASGPPAHFCDGKSEADPERFERSRFIFRARTKRPISGQRLIRRMKPRCFVCGMHACFMATTKFAS